MVGRIAWGNIIEAEMIQDESPQNNAERIGDYVWEMMNSDLPELSPFRDFIDLDIINWLELAEHYLKKKF